MEVILNYQIQNDAKRYGSVHKKEGIPKAKVSTCYDILNGFIVDVIVEKSLTN